MQKNGKKSNEYDVLNFIRINTESKMKVKQNVIVGFYTHFRSLVSPLFIHTSARLALAFAFVCKIRVRKGGSENFQTI